MLEGTADSSPRSGPAGPLRHEDDLTGNPLHHEDDLSSGPLQHEEDLSSEDEDEEDEELRRAEPVLQVISLFQRYTEITPDPLLHRETLTHYFTFKRGG